MQLGKYLINGILLLSPLIQAQTIHASVFEKKCGDKIFIVEMYNGFDIAERRYKLYSKASDGNKKLFFETESGIGLNAACIQDKNKRDLMLFLEHPGGNVAPEDLYGIYDPKTEKMLIKHTSWHKGNSKEVQHLIGYEPPLLQYENEKIFFCCHRRDYQT